jgi:MFS family permease
MRVAHDLARAEPARAPVGWSFLEGVGAALILPAIVALVAANFATERRPAAYGMVAAAGAIAVAVGPLVGGFCTTYFSWRWVFAGEVVLVLVILAAHPQDRRRSRPDAPAPRRRRRRPLGGRACDARLRRPPLERVGLDRAEAGCAVVGGLSPTSGSASAGCS